MLIDESVIEAVMEKLKEWIGDTSASYETAHAIASIFEAALRPRVCPVCKGSDPDCQWGGVLANCSMWGKDYALRPKLPDEVAGLVEQRSRGELLMTDITQIAITATAEHYREEGARVMKEAVLSQVNRFITCDWLKPSPGWLADEVEWWEIGGSDHLRAVLGAVEDLHPAQVAKGYTP